MVRQLKGRVPVLEGQMKGRVAVAMSGGVDSSLSAALLKDAGYEVVGVTLRLWPYQEPEGEIERFNTCCSPRAVEDARQVACQLGIPFYLLNYQVEFEKKVIDYFLGEYLLGKTPNPCIPCNSLLKFGSLLQRARGWGLDFVATGHYARVEYNPEASRYLLKRAVDPLKDQTYFLYNLSQDQLCHILMPLGSLEKQEVRRRAAGLGLRVATKPDSQEICFIPEKDYKPFLRGRLGDQLRPGLIRDLEGRVLGEHPGVAFFTVGQRRGLKISGKRPLYVVRIDSLSNEVIVGEEGDLLAKGLWATEVSFIPFDRLCDEKRALVKIRYNHRPTPARLVPRGEGVVEVRFDQPQRAIAPGQAAVFYDGGREEIVMGGGTIAKAIS